MKIVALVILFYALAAFSQSVQVEAPATAKAGGTFTVSTSGSGAGKLYIIGAGHVSRRDIQLGNKAEVGAEDTSTAGDYQILACGGSECGSAQVQVLPAEPADVVFLVHPSRVPVSESNGISAVAVVLDRFQNVAWQPSTVTFRAGLKDAPAASLPLKSHDGIAWARLNSGPKEGRVVLEASVGDASEQRVVQQFASEACNLHANAQPSRGRLILQTDPVRDCRGNALPDGTIVTFTMVDQAGRSTVDAPIKKGVARTELNYSAPATISVACGVSLGNEIRLGGGR